MCFNYFFYSIPWTTIKLVFLSLFIYFMFILSKSFKDRAGTKVTMLDGGNESNHTIYGRDT